MKIKLVLTIPTALRKDVNLLALLNDALAEFMGERTPAAEYVQKRYPDGYTGDHRRDNEKIQEVIDRVQVAKVMRSTLTITSENEACKTNDDCPSCALQDTCQDTAALVYREE